MNIHLKPYPTMDEVLRLFSENYDATPYKKPRGNYEDCKSYLSKSGMEAFCCLTSFLIRLATLANGGTDNCENLTIAEMVENFKAIIRGEETGD